MRRPIGSATGKDAPGQALAQDDNRRRRVVIRVGEVPPAQEPLTDRREKARGHGRRRIRRHGISGGRAVDPQPWSAYESRRAGQASRLSADALTETTPGTDATRSCTVFHREAQLLTFMRRLTRRRPDEKQTAAGQPEILEYGDSSACGRKEQRQSAAPRTEPPAEPAETSARGTRDPSVLAANDRPAPATTTPWRQAPLAPVQR